MMHGAIVMVFLTTVELPPPATAFVPEEPLASDLRDLGLLAWRRRRAPRIFDDFLVISMPGPFYRRRHGADHGASAP